jgi:hypothetical protein
MPLRVFVAACVLVGGLAQAVVSSAPAQAASLPTITLATPKTGTTVGGTAVTITGTNFASVTAVKFGTTAGTSVVVASATKLTVHAPAHVAGVLDVRVTTARGDVGGGHRGAVALSMAGRPD